MDVMLLLAAAEADMPKLEEVRPASLRAARQLLCVKLTRSCC